MDIQLDEQSLLVFNRCLDLLPVAGPQIEEDILGKIQLMEPKLRDYPLSEILGKLVSKDLLAKKGERYFLTEKAYSQGCPFI